MVQLTKNRLYPTYQLFARMGSKKTTPQDGLVLAALTTLEWLCKRLGEGVPPELADLPDPDDYRTADPACLKSVRVNCGYVVDILSLPEQGVWTLQITEPDLGSDPGNPEQERVAVPGRVFETNVAYKIVGKELHCGFRTVISDPESAAEPAEVYRLSLVRKLAAHPDFGLRQLTMLTESAAEITTAEQLAQLKSVWRDDGNQLPCVVFTKRAEGPAPAVPELPTFTAVPQLTPLKMPELLPQTPKQEAAVPYDIEDFTKYAVSFGRVYVLDEALFDRFLGTFGLQGEPGSIFVLEPPVFGGKRHIYPYKPNKTRRDETVQSLRELIYQYPRGKDVSFGTLTFLSAARAGLLAATESTLQSASAANEQWEQRIAHLELSWKEQFDKKDAELAQLREQLARRQEYAARIEARVAELGEEQAALIKKHEAALADKDEEIRFLQRKLTRPTDHADVAAWVEATFPDRLVMHPRAVELLKKNSAKSVDCGLICDALDFLATDYLDCRHQRIDKDEMLRRCSEKYGRPFEIKPIGAVTVEYTPLEYKIKYQLGGTDKAREYPMDAHLCVGNHAETLLRIYFLHDDERKQLVIGSLPHHLTTVSI